MSDEFDRYEELLERHFSEISHEFERRDAANCEVRIYGRFPFKDTCTFITFGLSEFVLQQTEDLPPLRMEIALVAPAAYRDRRLEAVLDELAGRVLERRCVIESGEIVHSEMLADVLTASKSSISELYCRAGIWLPEAASWIEADPPAEIVDAIPLTLSEVSLVKSNFERFKALTERGEIDLLDFAR